MRKKPTMTTKIISSEFKLVMSVTICSQKGCRFQDAESGRGNRTSAASGCTCIAKVICQGKRKRMAAAFSEMKKRIAKPVHYG
jgi:hypothetical protein